MPFVRRAMGRSRLCRGVLAVQRHEAGARICCANLVARPCVGCLRRLAGAGEALRWLASAFRPLRKTRVNHLPAGARFALRRRAKLQRCKLSADTYFSSLARFRCRRSASVSWCRERSHWLHTKCINNSGAKPAYCAAKHINHSSDQRSNEAPATNDAVVPRARR